MIFELSIQRNDPDFLIMWTKLRRRRHHPRSSSYEGRARPAAASRASTPPPVSLLRLTVIVYGAEFRRLQGVSTNIQGQLNTCLKTTTDFQERIGDVLFNTILVRDLVILGGDMTAVSHADILQLSGITSNVQTQLDLKAPVNSPTFTGTVSGVTKAMVGLANADNTSDLAKPISTATQTALDLKATTSALITVSADLAALQADHDTHVSTDAVTVTQTITGTKTFSILNATTLNIPFGNIVPQFNPVTLVVRTVFGSNTRSSIKTMSCSICTLYWGGIASVENNSERVASIRINRLNSFQIARFTSSNSWTNVAAINAGSYGLSGTRSIKLFYGSLNAGTAVEIVSDLFS
eukprot:gene24679-29821_t